MKNCNLYTNPEIPEVTILVWFQGSKNRTPTFPNPDHLESRWDRLIKLNWSSIIGQESPWFCPPWLWKQRQKRPREMNRMTRLDLDTKLCQPLAFTRGRKILAICLWRGIAKLSLLLLWRNFVMVESNKVKYMKKYLYGYDGSFFITFLYKYINITSKLYTWILRDVFLFYFS